MKVHDILRSIRWLALVPALFFPLSARGQLSASGTINATLINRNGIALVFEPNPSGVSLSGAGSPAASLNFGTIAAYGTLSSGVTLTSVSKSSFTVQTFFDVQVIEGGLNSNSYTLSAQLAAAAPTGLGYVVDGVTLITAAQNIQTNGTYNTNVQHSLSLVVSTAAPGAGGPTVGSPLTTTLNFTATSN
jgi:hypothetical protein